MYSDEYIDNILANSCYFIQPQEECKVCKYSSGYIDSFKPLVMRYKCPFDSCKYFGDVPQMI